MRSLRPMAAVLLFLIGAAADAASTSVTVRVLAHDAKLIPGVQVVVRDADTGEVLERGVTEGGTGDTDLIVREPVARGERVFDTEGAAAHVTMLDLDAPRRVTIEALQPETGAAASKTLWLAPGHGVAGNGVVLELYGLDVTIREPAGQIRAGGELAVTAGVEMLCGCPVTPGGLWDADGFTVTAALLRDGETVAESPLSYAGEASTFSGAVAAPVPGEYTLRVVAAQPARGNFGVASAELAVTQPD